jgi:pullulanase
MSRQALKANMKELDSRIAAFSDDIRDGIKGSVFNAQEPGYVSGAYGRKEQIKFGAAGSVAHDQIDVSRLANSANFWAVSPTQTVTYASAHDNLTLWDKLLASTPSATGEEHLAMNRMAAAIVLTSQGIPFIHAGEELARSKDGDENSYKSPDSVNQIKWDTKTNRLGLFEYYQGLIALRKQYPAFRMTTAEQVGERLRFLETEPQTVAYTLEGNDKGTLLVAFNADKNERELLLPTAGSWAVLVDGERAGTEALSRVEGDKLTLTPRSAFVLRYDGEMTVEYAELGDGAVKNETPANGVPVPATNVPLITGIIIAAAVLSGALAVLILAKRKTNGGI